MCEKSLNVGQLDWREGKNWKPACFMMWEKGICRFLFSNAKSSENLRIDELQTAARKRGWSIMHFKLRSIK